MGISILKFVLVAAFSFIRVGFAFISTPTFIIVRITSGGETISRLRPSLNQSTQIAADVEVSAPDDAVIIVKPAAMNRLVELKTKQANPEETLVLRMGVRKGGCSGLSYVMDFSSESDIKEDDNVDEYAAGIKCVVDAKSMLYLYGMELDYSDELVGGGFKFFNPNAEKSCGCGSSFGL